MPARHRVGASNHGSEVGTNEKVVPSSSEPVGERRSGVSGSQDLTEQPANVLWRAVRIHRKLHRKTPSSRNQTARPNRGVLDGDQLQS